MIRKAIADRVGGINISMRDSPAKGEDPIVTDLRFGYNAPDGKPAAREYLGADFSREDIPVRAIKHFREGFRQLRMWRAAHNEVARWNEDVQE